MIGIERMIYLIRGQKVMLDNDLAKLYGVETRILNRNVKRNIRRFPEDFMFQLNRSEYKGLISQIGISNEQRGGRRKLPYVFTENGLAMLSGVLNSDRAIKVNISIMRTFTKLRKLLASDETLAERLNKLEKGSSKLFHIVFKRLDGLDAVTPPLPPARRKIGIGHKDLF